MRTVAWKLRRTGFIISPESVTGLRGEAAATTGLQAGKPGMLAAALRAWLKVLPRRHVREKTMLSTLEKVNRVVRPSGVAGPFLAGGYQTVQRAAGGMVDFSGTTARGVGTAIMLTHMPHHFATAKTEGFVFFSDAAEHPEHPGRFRVGVVGLMSCQWGPTSPLRAPSGSAPCSKPSCGVCT